METVANNAVNTVAAAPQSSTFGLIVYCGVIFAVIYLFMVRPNKKKMAEYNKMLSGIKSGAKILCAGGIYGTVKKIDGDKLQIEISKGIIIEVAKQSVINVI